MSVNRPRGTKEKHNTKPWKNYHDATDANKVRRHEPHPEDMEGLAVKLAKSVISGDMSLDQIEYDPHIPRETYMAARLEYVRLTKHRRLKDYIKAEEDEGVVDNQDRMDQDNQNQTPVRTITEHNSGLLTMGQAAEQMGISQQTLGYRLKKFPQFKVLIDGSGPGGKNVRVKAEAVTDASFMRIQDNFIGKAKQVRAAIKANIPQATIPEPIAAPLLPQNIDAIISSLETAAQALKDLQRFFK